ncbi:ABC transporter substrate-binding protein [Modestobacter sp. SYSU DS0290]
MRTVPPSRRPRLVRSALALTAVTALATGCQSAVEQADDVAASGEEAACQQGGTVVVAASGAPQTNRVLAQSATNLLWARAVFEPLMTVTTESIDDPQPLLAESWEFSDDDREVVLQLQEGVTFHSGRPFTAEDVLLTLQQTLDPVNASNVAPIVSQWEVEATGDLEVTIRSSAPLSPVLGSTLDMAPIVDSDTWAGVADGSQLIGTGPFQVTEYEPGASMSLTRYEDYWQDGVFLDGIELNIIPDSTAQVSALRSGRTQLSNGLTVQDALSVTEGSDQFELDRTINGVYPIVLDQVPDQRVRQAIAYAIDKERINEQVYGGLGTTEGLYWSQGSSDYPDDLANPYPYDPDQARQLIEEAGAEGTEVPITIINLPVIAAEYEIIANNLTEIGLQPSLTALAPPDYQQRLAAGSAGNFLALRGLNGTAAFMVQTNTDLRLTGAHRQTTTPEYEQLVEQVVQAEGDQGADAVRELTEYMNDQAVVVPLVTTEGVSVRSADVRNAPMDLMGWVPNETCFVR